MNGFNEHIKPSVDGEARLVSPELDGIDMEQYWQERYDAARTAMNYASSQLSKLAMKNMPTLDLDWY